MKNAWIAALVLISVSSVQSQAGFSLDSITSQVTEKVEEVKKITTKPGKSVAPESEAPVVAKSNKQTEAEASSGISPNHQSDIKRYCNRKDASNEICIEFLTFYYQNIWNHPEKIPQHYGYLERCFAQASFLKPDSTSLDAAVDAYEHSPSDDKYAKECFRLADIAYGNTKWHDASDARKKRNDFYRTIGKKIEEDFPKKCDGVMATNTSPGMLKFSVDRRVKNSKSVYQGKTPEGNKITVFCTGDIKTTFASGGSSVTYGETFDEGNKNTLSDQCIMTCASSRKSLACAKANGNFQDPACNQVCKAQCQ